jgi:hypothetical protein
MPIHWRASSDNRLPAEKGAGNQSWLDPVSRQRKTATFTLPDRAHIMVG